MDVFKKLAVVRRRNGRSGSIVSDDGVDDSDFCYHDSEAVLIGDDEVEVVDASNDSGDGNSSSLYGRRRNNTGSSADTCPPIMAVVTSTKFDSNETFSVVARAMIDRYQHKNMSEREAILGTLGKADDDLRAFIEALDLKFIVLTTQNTDGIESVDDPTLSEIVFKTRSIFDATLKAMWREKEATSSSIVEITGQEESLREYRDEMIDHDDDDEYRKQHPKTPKNLRMSPMRTSSYNYKNHGIISQSESLDSTCSEGSNNSLFRPFKRPRRWFFPQHKNERVSTTPLFSSSGTKIAPAAIKPFPIKAALPKFHFDFGKNSSNNSNNNNTSKKNSFVFGDLGRVPKPVQSLHLDGTFSSYVASMGDGNGSTPSYMPPTSPIRKVSIEMHTNEQQQ